VKHQKGKMEAHGGTRNLPYSTLVNYGAKLWDWCLCGDFNWNILGDCAKGFVWTLEPVKGPMNVSVKHFV
jgi:hypothetical protein